MNQGEQGEAHAPGHGKGNGDGKKKDHADTEGPEFLLYLCDKLPEHNLRTRCYKTSKNEAKAKPNPPGDGEASSESHPADISVMIKKAILCLQQTFPTQNQSILMFWPSDVLTLFVNT